MSTHKNIDKICVVITVIALIITILFMNGSKFGIKTLTDADSESNSDNEYFTDNDLDGSWDTQNAATITLDGDSASFTGSGCYIYDNSIVIASSGKYVVTGSLTDGSLVVSANDNSKVWILFDNVSIENDDDACLIIDQADKVFLTLAEDSVNTLTSGSSYSEDALSDNTDGTIFAHDDLTINGSGSLNITAGYKHGISANDDLVITGGSVSITAPKDAIHANDSLRVANADLTVDSEDDGLAVDEEDAYIYIESGTFNISCTDEGIYAPGDITIAGGDLEISVDTSQGHHGIKAGGTFTITGGTVLISSCYEGIQANYIDICDGDLTIYPADDGLNASTGGGSGAMGMDMGGGMQITEDFSGEMPEMSGTPGEMSEMGGTPGEMPEMGGTPGEMPEMGGTPGEMPEMNSSSAESSDTGSSSSEMSEMNSTPGEMPEMNSSSAESSDTGSSSSEMSEMNSTPDEMPEMNSSPDTDSAESSDGSEDIPWLHISGGSLLIVNDSGQDADGLDSNGDIIISGGDIRVSLMNSGTNSAIDYGSESGGVCEITGGTIAACGSYSMAEGFESSSTQCSILYNISSGAEAGTTISVEDADSNVLLSYEVPCSFSSATLSCPEMTLGETYTIIVGDSYEEVTLSNTATSSGDAESTMFGGSFTPGGGMQDRGGFGGQEQDMGHNPGSFDSSTGSPEGMPEFPGNAGGPPDNPQDNAGSTGENTEGQMPQTDSSSESSEGQTPQTDSSSESSEEQMPQTDGGSPEMSGGPGGQMDSGAPQGQESDTSEAEDDAVETEVSSESEGYTTETLIICGISILVLIAGLIFAFRFKRH